MGRVPGTRQTSWLAGTGKKSSLRGNYPRSKRAAGPLPNVPVILFTGLQGNPGGTRLALQLHKEWLKDIPNATQIVTEKSSHYLHRSEPALVIDAIRKLVSNVRDRGPSPRKQ